MIGREHGLLIPRLLRRFDHWLLLRAPMLWRTRLLHCVLVLFLLILTTSLFLQTSIEHPSEIQYSGVTSKWGLQVFGAFGALVLWVRSILRKPVGEIALRRHVVTIVAVTIGSYIWLVTPSLLALVEIKTIAGVKPNDGELTAEREILGRYQRWNCIPPRVWKDEPALQIELEQLRPILARYVRDKIDLKTAMSDDYMACTEGDSRKVAGYGVHSSFRIIETISDAHNLWSENWIGTQFSDIRASLYWFAAIAIGIGLLTAIFSYPKYVWRRIFSIAD